MSADNGWKMKFDVLRRRSEIHDALFQIHSKVVALYVKALVHMQYLFIS